ncbi:hypothetical protein [Nocardia brasiliensis]|uniref:Uncharacterized protein n=1 Tax=Nocardia brasiliensis (strain ATCC 700358 / HUJEG-1) TaxID=1133849 RepID=K0FAI1_NOCB7|nr:hypothetical protein [Nocardia brasiliensis]AFU04461.1 hypothetical protein O3I_032560 [Nocardia brasiliensis ATCC 700358]OCF85696.1 hypothetical protein AW168_34705 [Nocardia brasiliensis]
MIYKLGTAVAAGAAAALLFSGAAGAHAFEPGQDAKPPTTEQCEQGTSPQSGDVPADGTGNGNGTDGEQSGAQPSGTSDPLTGMLDSGSAKAPIAQPTDDNGSADAPGCPDQSGTGNGAQEGMSTAPNGAAQRSGGSDSNGGTPKSGGTEKNGGAEKSGGAEKNGSGKKAE